MMNVTAEPTEEIYVAPQGRARIWRARTKDGLVFYMAVRGLVAGSRDGKYPAVLRELEPFKSGDPAGVAVEQLDRLDVAMDAVDIDRVARAAEAMGVAPQIPPPAPAGLNEIFLLQLTRAEMDLVFGMLSSVYAYELAQAITPTAEISFAPGAGKQPFPAWLRELGGKQISAIVSKFVREQGIDAMRDAVNKFLKLLGRTELK